MFLFICWYVCLFVSVCLFVFLIGSVNTWDGWYSLALPVLSCQSCLDSFVLPVLSCQSYLASLALPVLPVLWVESVNTWEGWQHPGLASLELYIIVFIPTIEFRFDTEKSSTTYSFWPKKGATKGRIWLREGVTILPTSSRSFEANMSFVQGKLLGWSNYRGGGGLWEGHLFSKRGRYSSAQLNK